MHCFGLSEAIFANQSLTVNCKLLTIYDSVFKVKTVPSIGINNSQIFGIGSAEVWPVSLLSLLFVVPYPSENANEIDVVPHAGVVVRRLMQLCAVVLFCCRSRAAPGVY